MMFLERRAQRTVRHHEQPAAHTTHIMLHVMKCLLGQVYERSWQDSWDILVAAGCYQSIHDPPLPRLRKAV